jgi:hypothetical protein
MKHLFACLALALALAVSLAACSLGSEESNSANPPTGTVEKNAAPPFSASRTREQEEANIKENAATTTMSSALVIGREGLGVLRIGQPVPRNGSWAERGAQT